VNVADPLGADCHAYASVADPLATTLNVAVVGGATIRLMGCVVIVGAVEAALIVMLYVCTAVGFTLLLAVTVIGPAVPAAVGVPDNVLPLRVSHAGRPLIVSVGAGLPVATIV
jgi:hypothetical protein